MAPYKDKDKQREAVRLNMRRWRARKKAEKKKAVEGVGSGGS
jgi:hypothetical protein